MARVVKEHDVRRNEIIDHAQRLVMSKGYEQMTIQDILDELHISKGAFYHYFDSKQAMLEALIERLMETGEQLLAPVVQDTSLPVLERLQHYFDVVGRWKGEQKVYLLSILRVWYMDDNAIVRQKTLAAQIERFTQVMNEMIRQGVQQGALHPAYPDQAGAVVLSLLQNLGDALARTLLSGDLSTAEEQSLYDVVAAYTDAIEHALGAPSGSIVLVDDANLKEWMIAAGNQ
jgi:AcrR family transcriptional regulator